jgi:hypothetical protein
MRYRYLLKHDGIVDIARRTYATLTVHPLPNMLNTLLTYKRQNLSTCRFPLLRRFSSPYLLAIRLWNDTTNSHVHGWSIWIPDLKTNHASLLDNCEVTLCLRIAGSVLSHDIRYLTIKKVYESNTNVTDRAVVSFGRWWMSTCTGAFACTHVHWEAESWL